MNPNKLRSKMVLFGDTNTTLGKALGIAYQTFSAKINTTNGAEFTQGEIQIMKDRYNLTAEEIDEIFFNQEVSCEDTKMATSTNN